MATGGGNDERKNGALIRFASVSRVSNAHARAHACDRTCAVASNRSSRAKLLRYQFELSTGGTDELVTSPNHQDHADSGGYSAHSSNPSERTWQLLLGIATMIIAKFVVAM